LVVAIAFVFLSWLFVLARWRNRRMEGNAAAFLMSTLMTGTIGLYPMARDQLYAALLLILIVGAFIQYLFGRYVLNVFAEDRPPSI
jgi:uncharacterized membrane protein YfcA